MIWIIGEAVLLGVAVLVALAALAGAFRLPARTNFGEVIRPAQDLTRTAILGVGIVFVIATIGLTVWRSYYPIPAGEVGVVSEFGKIVSQVDEGPQFIAPWQDLRKVDIKVQRAEFRDGVLGRISAASAETQNVFFNVTLNWQVSPSAVQGLMRNVGPDFFNTLVPTRVRQFFKAEVVKFTAVEATQKREEIRVAVEGALRADLNERSLIVVALLIDDISYESAFEQSIESKQVASQDALRAQEVVAQRTAEALQAEAQAKGEAAAQVARAEGDKLARILTAEAENQARILAAEAEAAALVLEGDAKAEANRAIAASLTTDLIQFEALKQLAGVEIALLPAGSNFLLDPTNILRRSP
ncbi:MAG: prohibitin family protein [Dehalococcoidia bacterium]|jgi:regulator of protease activity HflC (stomatin/prohibitin superfamily)|nr:prohibitin family protein [Dehalococcoidia bacterium]